MIAQRTMTNNTMVHTTEAAVQEAMRLLSARPRVQCWACDVCGMLHRGTAPTHCDSCGVVMSPSQRVEPCRECNSRW